MPRLKRRTKQRRTGWTAAHILQLETGAEYFDDAFGRHSQGTLDVDVMRQAWGELRDELLSRWFVEHPGTRPFAWWFFDAPERRRRIGTMKLKPGIDPNTQARFDDGNYESVEDGAAHPFDNPERNAKVDRWRQDHPDVANREAYKLSAGVPGCLMVPDDFQAVYEAEAEYLDRLGLLTESEQVALAAGECAGAAAGV